jgi:hypothetical protein
LPTETATRFVVRDLARLVSNGDENSQQVYPILDGARRATQCSFITGITRIVDELFQRITKSNNILHHLY